MKKGHKMLEITVQEAVTKIRSSRGKFFTVLFTKRSDNTTRKMNCRTGVRKDLKGEGKPKKLDLITVYDMVKKEYRNINVSGLREIKIGRKNYKVK